MQAALHLIYPPQCILCDCLVTSDFGLCPTCWRETPILIGLVCDLCGAPLAGEDPGHPLHCDDCLQVARPWRQGRAAMLYEGGAREMVLKLKHGDRQDLVRPAVNMMLRAGRGLFDPDMVVAPIPLHWRRFLLRRYNQAALLSRGIARAAGLRHCPDLLQRIKATPKMENAERDARFSQLSEAIRLTPRHRRLIFGRSVLLVDDVMTSGATFHAGTEACLAAGARDVRVLALCRVAKSG